MSFTSSAAKSANPSLEIERVESRTEYHVDGKVVYERNHALRIKRVGDARNAATETVNSAVPNGLGQPAFNALILKIQTNPAYGDKVIAALSKLIRVTKDEIKRRDTK